MTFQIRDPWNRGNAIQVRLGIGALRAYGLSKEDVMKAFGSSRMIVPNQPKEPLPPLGVVFQTPLLKPDQYEYVIIKANADGDVIRLKEVAKLELLASREAKDGDTYRRGK